MIKHYHTLKRHCNVIYNIDSIPHKIGNLSDAQLEIAERILKTRMYPDKEHKLQLDAIKYVSTYRSNANQEIIQEQLPSKMTKRLLASPSLNGRVDIIMNWLDNTCKWGKHKKIHKASELIDY